MTFLAHSLELDNQSDLIPEKTVINIRTFPLSHIDLQSYGI